MVVSRWLNDFKTGIKIVSDLVIVLAIVSLGKLICKFS